MFKERCSPMEMTIYLKRRKDHIDPSILPKLPIYLMSIFQMPKGVGKKLEEIQMSRRSPIKQSTLGQVPSMQGNNRWEFGVSRFTSFNLALQAKMELALCQ